MTPSYSEEALRAGQAVLAAFVVSPVKYDNILVLTGFERFNVTCWADLGNLVGEQSKLSDATLL